MATCFDSHLGHLQANVLHKQITIACWT